MLLESREIGLTNALLNTDLDDGDPNAFLPAADYCAGPLAGHQFFFWTRDGAPSTLDPGATCVAIQGDTTHVATKWYLAVGPGQPGPPGVGVFAFSIAQNKFVTETPVASAVPLGSLSGNNTVQTGASAVTVTAKDFIGAGSLTEPFSHWWKVGDPGPVNGGNPVLQLPKGAGGIAIAYFGQPKTKRPRVPAAIDPIWLLAPKVALLLTLPDPGPEAVTAQFRTTVLNLKRWIEVIEKQLH